MKKILLIMMISLAPLFAYQVDFTKKFSKVVNPDLLTTYVSINIEKKDEESINEIIEKFNKFIKNNNLVDIKDGSYTLNPRYNYFDNKQEFKGYMGSLRYKIESKKAKPLNEFIDKLISIKKDINSKDTKLDISNITWNISDKLNDKTVDDLRLEVITWVNEYAKELSSKVSKKCKVKNISLTPIQRREIMYANSEMMHKSKRATQITPTNTEENISIEPTFVLECK